MEAVVEVVLLDKCKIREIAPRSIVANFSPTGKKPYQRSGNQTLLLSPQNIKAAETI